MDEEDDIIIQQQNINNGLKFNQEELEIIKKQMKNNSVCKIKKGNSHGTGSFIKITDKKNNNKQIGVLVSNAHVLGKDDIGKDRDIIIYELNNKDNKDKVIDMKGRKRYINELLDITIVEIKEKDGIKDEQYLELDDIKNDSQEIFEKSYKGKGIYAIGYPKDNKITVSFGNIKGIYEDKSVCEHSCDTDFGSSGSPMFFSDTFKVFSIHSGYFFYSQKNTNVLIFDAINEFFNYKDNLIYINDPKWEEKRKKQKKMEEEEEKNNNKEKADKNQENETKKNSMIIKYIVKSEIVKIFGRKFVKKNISKCKMIIIDNSTKELDILEYYKVNAIMLKNRCFYIKLIELTPISDMSYIFGKFYHDEGAVQIQKLKDISNWDTKYVTNMSKFFCECNELTEVCNLSKLNTQNVTNMSFFFFGCENLKKIEGIEYWETNNVENMNNMFAYCKKLESLPNLEKWNVEKVKDLSYIFYHCESINALKGINKWKAKNLQNCSDIDTGCIKLAQKINTSSLRNSMFSN